MVSVNLLLPCYNCVSCRNNDCKCVFRLGSGCTLQFRAHHVLIGRAVRMPDAEHELGGAAWVFEEQAQDSIPDRAHEGVCGNGGAV